MHAAYELGLFITVLALLAAWRAIPPSPPGRPGDLDVPGAILLGGGLLALLIPVSQSGLWTSAPLAAGLLLAVAAALLAGWAWWENRAAAPLTDLRLLRHPAVAGANLAISCPCIRAAGRSRPPPVTAPPPGPEWRRWRSPSPSSPGWPEPCGGVELAKTLDQPGHQAGPPGLIRRTD